MPLFKTAPAIRLLAPFIVGILLQWYGQFQLPMIVVIGILSLIAYFSFTIWQQQIQFVSKHWQGLFLNILLLAIGMFCTYRNNVQHNTNWYGNHLTDSTYIVATVNEPPVEKKQSIKVDATVQAIIQPQKTNACNGKLLLYFSKDSASEKLQYGDVILIDKPLQKIKNAGNPGGFDYERFSAFHQVYYNCFLKKGDWTLAPKQNKHFFWSFIYTAKSNILKTLQKYIGNNRDRLGIAEALLIGYTNDLDKDLVQAYTNTGVVHIIAISGMHLGLIYVLLVWLLDKIPGIKKSKSIQVILTLSFLWLFAILTGGSASVCRSAVMFTFIAIGSTFFTQSSIYNSLAASAFVMLCYNPYYLWDVGFQLSYLAVIGIVSIQPAIYHAVYFKNNILDAIWKLVAISLAAQVLTFPICLYYFHQFPTFFLFTNLIAVPLSSIILYGIIALMVCSGIPLLANVIGSIINWLLWLMNAIIQWFNGLPISVWDNIPATFYTTVFLYLAVCSTCIWAINKSKQFLFVALVSAVAFVATQAFNNWQLQRQQKVIVYNVPQKQAIDFVQGNSYLFRGDTVLLEDGLLQNFHLKPGRIKLQLNKRQHHLDILHQQYPFYQFGNKKILLLDSNFKYLPPPNKIDIDLVIVSNNPPLKIPQLLQIFNCRQFVFDASNSMWKIDKWQATCSELHLPSYSVQKQGAFVLAMQ
jgi:competence protein ComEC